jgi:ribosome biogenesis GTPase
MGDTVGTVIEVHPSRCHVRVGDGVIPCRRRKRLMHGPRAERNVLVVGDRVRVERVGGEGVVTEVLERGSELIRSVPGRPRHRHVIAANVDQVLIVSATRRPAIRTGLIDRCIAAARVSDLPAVVCINKMDLVTGRRRAEMETIAGTYRSAGFDCLLMSAVKHEGLDALARRLQGRTSVLVGHSGVGKSAILNAIQPGWRLRVGEVSGATLRGRHTTTGSRLLSLDAGGFVVDTPGVRAFGLEEMTPAQILLAYPEFAPLAASCRFNPCGHTHEPDCAVRAAVAAGAIAGWRYDNYRRIVESVQADDG